MYYCTDAYIRGQISFLTFHESGFFLFGFEDDFNYNLYSCIDRFLDLRFVQLYKLRFVMYNRTQLSSVVQYRSTISQREKSVNVRALAGRSAVDDGGWMAAG